MQTQALSASLFVLLGAAQAAAAGGGLEASIAENRMGTLRIRTHPGAQIRVEQIRHEFWFGATLPGSIFSGHASAEDVARFKEVFVSHFNAGVIESAFKWHDMEREKGIVNYSIVDAMLAWADKQYSAARPLHLLGSAEPRAGLVKALDVGSSGSQRSDDRADGPDVQPSERSRPQRFRWLVTRPPEPRCPHPASPPMTCNCGCAVLRRCGSGYDYEQPCKISVFESLIRNSC